jgi:heme exporter protein A
MDLVVDALSARRAGRRVFADVSFRVGAGEAATLRGPNGSGKSSLLRVLAGLIPPERGGARFGDTALSDREAWQEQVAYAGHLDAVKPQLSVAENLESWASLYGAEAGTVDAALARFGLEAIADYPASYCSAGQKRRLGLARLPVAGRPLWLLDEPTVSLDAASVAVFAEMVRDHLAGGGVAVAATHIPLGLDDGPTVEMRAPAAESAQGDGEAADPFLDGAW